MKILYLLLAVLLIVLQRSLGFMRLPNDEAQCEQAGGICSKNHCFHLHSRAFGRCQRGVQCCRAVVSYSCTRISCLLGNEFVKYLSKYTQRVSDRFQRFTHMFITTQNNEGEKSNNNNKKSFHENIYSGITGIGSPGRWLNHHLWMCLRAVWMWCSGIWFSRGLLELGYWLGCGWT
uniref:Gallinacin-8-like n=1 Tax=Coturnix japonica TaxID=93934 RepID=A0A8C2SME5_COTJA